MTIWVVLSTVRISESKEIAELVMKTPTSLAIAVNKDVKIFNHLKEIQEEFPDRFLLVLSEFAGQVEAVNYVYGAVRMQNPSKNILFVPVPDDMPMRDGWHEAFSTCYETLQDGIGVLAGYDGHGHSGFAGTTAKYCDIYQKGWLHCPEYIHFQVDHELRVTAQKHGKFYICREAQALHKMLDSQKNTKTEAWQLDAETYRDRRRIRFSYDEVEAAPWRYWK